MSHSAAVHCLNNRKDVMAQEKDIARRVILGMLASGLMLVALPAMGQSDEQDRVRDALRRGEILSYAEIRRRAQARFDGRVVGQSLRPRGRGWIYDLRLLRKDGTVLSVQIDARTGRVLSTRGRR